jgi:hypothetical protein
MIMTAGHVAAMIAFPQRPTPTHHRVFRNGNRLQTLSYQDTN